MEILEKIIVDKITPANKNVLWCDISGDKPYLRKNISGQWKSLYVSTLYQVNVTSGDGGTATSSKSKFKVGDSVTLAATNSQGYAFSKWQSSADGVSYTDISGATNAEYTVTLTEEKDYYFKAVFVQVFSVNVTSGGNGSVLASANTVVAGGSVTLAATANDGYAFSKWSDNNTDNPRTITNVQQNISLSATFKQEVSTKVELQYGNGNPVSIYDFDYEESYGGESPICYWIPNESEGEMQYWLEGDIICDSNTMVISFPQSNNYGEYLGDVSGYSNCYVQGIGDFYDKWLITIYDMNEPVTVQLNYWGA